MLNRIRLSKGNNKGQNNNQIAPRLSIDKVLLLSLRFNFNLHQLNPPMRKMKQIFKNRQREVNKFQKSMANRSKYTQN
jgi:hypothetical protein